MHTTHFIVNLFMSKVYNESYFKINQHVSCLFFRICIIHYAQLYKSCHTLFYDQLLQVYMPNEYFIHVIYLLMFDINMYNLSNLPNKVSYCNWRIGNGV